MYTCHLHSAEFSAAAPLGEIIVERELAHLSSILVGAGRSLFQTRCQEQGHILA